jgi:hypothetical protein
MKDEPYVAEVAIKKLSEPPATQMRPELDEGHVLDLVELLEDPGFDFADMVRVVYDGKHYWLWDGHHTVEACRRLGRKIVYCQVTRGTFRDAVLLACGANATHGLLRSNADKRKAVETLLDDKEWGAWSGREIARRCGVVEGLVRKIRAERAHSTRTPDRAGAVLASSPVERAAFDALPEAVKIEIVRSEEARAVAERAQELAAEAKQPGEPVRVTLSLPAELMTLVDARALQEEIDRRGLTILALEAHLGTGQRWSTGACTP